MSTELQQVSRAPEPSGVAELSSQELPQAGAQTIERIRQAIEDVRAATPSQLQRESGAFKALLGAVAVRGADADLKGLLKLLEGDSLQHVEDERGRSLEEATVHALLASGNPLALAIPTGPFQRYQLQAGAGQASFSPGRTTLGLVLTASALLIASLTALLFWSSVPAGKNQPLELLVALVVHGFIPPAAASALQALKKKRSASPLWPVLAASLGLLTFLLFTVMLRPSADLLGDLAFAGLFGLPGVLGPLLLIPGQKKATM